MELTIEIPYESGSFNWKEFLKKAVELKAFELELKRDKQLKLLLVKAITTKSKLSESEADKFSLELSNRIKEERLKKLKSEGLL